MGILWLFLEDSWSAASYASNLPTFRSYAKGPPFGGGGKHFGPARSITEGQKNHLPIRIRVKIALDLVLSSQLVFKILISNPPLPNNPDHNGLD